MVINSNSAKVIKDICIIAGCAIVVFLLVSSVPYSVFTSVAESSRWTRSFFHAFTAGAYLVNLILAVILSIYGVWLVRSSSSHGGGAGKLASAAAIRLYVLLAVLVLVALARIIVAVTALLLFAVEDNHLLWVQYNLVTIKFQSESVAVLYYVVVILLPDSIPCFAVVFILLPSKFERAGSVESVAVPLLEDSSKVPANYVI